ncbi:MAG: hypothetical protein H0U53_06480 [Actinobacteria bacterium]|nr:hypothetical protein [Actinomycetota bacterium]
MTLSVEEIVFRTRALAQAHPFTPRAEAYLKATVAKEQSVQPAPEIGIWAGYAIRVGYCLRRVEENDSGKDLGSPSISGAPDDLDELATLIADRIRGEAADELLLYPEPLVISALDHIIAGEVDRRLSHGSDEIDQETFGQLEAYLAWWVIKGYSLRIAELVSTGGAREVSETR